MLPTIDISMSFQLNETDQLSSYRFTDTSTSLDFLSVVSFAATMLGVIYILGLVYNCITKRQRRAPSYACDEAFTMEKRVLKGHSHKVDMVIVDGPYVVSVSCEGSVRVWDANSTECVLEVQPKKR